MVSWESKSPVSKLLLLGYSQGAHIVGDISQTIIRGGIPGVPAENLIGSVLFGDPAFNPTSIGTVGNYASSAHGLMGIRDAYSSALQAKILSWCDHGDLICQGSGLLNFVLQTIKIALYRRFLL